VPDALCVESILLARRATVFSTITASASTRRGELSRFSSSCSAITHARPHVLLDLTPGNLPLS